MKKLLGIVVLGLFYSSNASASYGSLWDTLMNPKDHSYCSKVVKNIKTGKYTKTDWYYECRLQLELFGNFNWKYQYMKDE
jgi:hypothetical protein